MTATTHPLKVAFVVSMAGAGVCGEDISVMQVEDAVLARGLPVETARFHAAKQRRDLAVYTSVSPADFESRLDSLAALTVQGWAFLLDDVKEKVRSQIRTVNSPWTRFFLSYDPAADISRVSCPVLAINGDKDRQVRSGVNLDAISAALESGGNSQSTIIEYPGLNHLFQTADTGAVEEYSAIEETISPKVLADLADWILKITR